jgi:hypothetical protein
MRFNNRAMALAGIPDLPEEAFKHDGDRKIKPQGGGGSPAPAPAPTSQTVTQTAIPEYAKPYVERMLGKAEALTNAPYQAYGGERTAGFNPMQQQAMQGVANLQPSQQLGIGTQTAGLGALGSLNAGNQYNQMATNPFATGAFMSPFIHNALQPQMREAARTSAIQGQQDMAQAAQRGAFGGSRSALMEAERRRNLNMQQGDIYAKGMQTAFDQARDAQRYGADLGLRGMGQAITGGSTLGQIGQTQFGQQKDILNAQAAAGKEQQALQQQILDQQFQDFLTQKGFNQQQLSFMSDILRGVPLGGQTQQQFTAPQSTLAQMGGLGLTALGAKQAGIFANGGLAQVAANKLMEG